MNKNWENILHWKSYFFSVATEEELKNVYWNDERNWMGLYFESLYMKSKRINKSLKKENKKLKKLLKKT